MERIHSGIMMASGACMCGCICARFIMSVLDRLSGERGRD